MPLNRDDFEHWLFDMDDELERFFASLPSAIREKLDYSPESLSVVEEWLLARYDSCKEIIRAAENLTLDQASRYVGETFRKNIGGIWTIELEDRKRAFFNLPVLRKVGEWEDCPVTLVTASLDRRTGGYMEKVLRNKIAKP